MGKLVATVLFFCCLSTSAYAEGWYIAQNNRPTVMSDDGNWYMFLEKTAAGDANVYLTSRNLINCTQMGTAKGMYVNGTKVRWYQNCDPSMGMYWYAYTTEGKNFLIGEFMKKEAVIIQDNSLIMRFSALGFNEKTHDFIDEILNPGL